MNSSVLKRGEGFISIRQIYENCFLEKEGISMRTVENVIKWLKRKQQITVRKTERGIVVNVHNYDIYQNLDHYTNGMKNGNSNGAKTEQKRDGSGTLYKENKKIKKEKKILKEKDFYNLKNLNEEISYLNPDAIKPLGNKPF